MHKASNFCLHNAGMITTDILCANRIVAVAAGGGDGPPTIKKWVKNVHLLEVRTYNVKTMAFGCCSGTLLRDAMSRILSDSHL